MTKLDSELATEPEHAITDNPILPYDYAKQHQLLISNQSDLTLYFVNTPSIFQLQELQCFIKHPFKYQRIAESRFQSLLQKLYETQKDQPKLSDFSNIDVESFASKVAQTQDLLSQNDDAPMITLINGIIAKAIQLKASDIHIEPYEKILVIRYRVDGMLKQALKLDVRLSSAMISRLKIVAKLDISERRLPQDGRVSLALGEKRVDVRISSLPSAYGERMVLRLLDKEAAQLNIEQLGLPAPIIQSYKKNLNATEGIILITGPTGSGKTTSLYAGLRHLNSSQKNILTIEDPVEYTLEGIGQSQVNSKTGYSFAKGLRAILRQDPDIVMVGEIRDEETARIAIQSSLTGHLVLSTVHTNSAIGAITRLRDIGIESYLLASSLKLIISQRLIRRLCEQCKKEVSLNATLAKLLELEENTPCFQHVGCDACDQTGYKGRIALAESVSISDQLQELIHDNASEKQLKALAFKQQPSIELASQHLIKSGITSAEEFLNYQIFN